MGSSIGKLASLTRGPLTFRIAYADDSDRAAAKDWQLTRSEILTSSKSYPAISTGDLRFPAPHYDLLI